jgi:cholesterol transport system auxiliary component
MSPTTLPRLLLAASMVTLLGGCSILGSSEKTAVTLYSPSVQVKADPAWPQASWQLVLAKPSAARMVDSPRINVRPTPSQLEIYKGASWAQPATDMIEDTLLRGFEDSGRIRGVARSTAGIRADYKLSTDVRRFESDYQGQATPTVVIEVNAKLIHVADQRGRRPHLPPGAAGRQHRRTGGDRRVRAWPAAAGAGRGGLDAGGQADQPTVR